MKARIGSTLAATLVLFAVTAPSAGGDAKSKKTELEGTWKAVKKDSVAQRMKFVGNTFEGKINGKVIKGTFTLKKDEKPAYIDLKITQSAEEKYKGKTALGIYEFQDGNLRWCSSQPGRKRRPQQFVSVMGDARLLLATFKKK